MAELALKAKRTKRAGTPNRFALILLTLLASIAILSGCGNAQPTATGDKALNQAAESPQEPLPPFLLHASAKGKGKGRFEEVLANVKGALSRKNFPVSRVRDYRQSLEKRFAQTGGGSLPFHQYVIIETCNLAMAGTALETDPRMGVFFPCRVVVYQLKPNGPVEVLTANPRFMAAIMNNPDLNVMADQLEDAMKEVLDSMDF